MSIRTRGCQCPEESILVRCITYHLDQMPESQRKEYELIRGDVERHIRECKDCCEIIQKAINLFMRDVNRIATNEGVYAGNDFLN